MTLDKIKQYCNSKRCGGLEKTFVKVEELNYKEIFAVYKCEKCGNRIYMKQDDKLRNRK